MLRIWVMPGREATTVRLEGRLLAAWRDELIAACERAVQNGAPVRLDLRSLTYADADGIELLRRLVDADHVQIGACSRFVAELLNGLDGLNGERKDLP